VKLLRLTLKNFKGIRRFELDAGGEDVTVYGDNATGKTTLFDAFTWLLFDKDSGNRKDFDIKTLGPDGEPEHGLEHEVEGLLDLGGKRIALRKVYYEKWTKKRGSAEKQFTGHTTDYYIDGVPVKKSEYQARIALIADENVFRLLTDPTYFNEQLHWQERRRILLDVCGDVSDSDVIAADSGLARLPAILDGRSLDDHRKVLAARRTEINRELEKIPVRIDEVLRGLPDLSAVEDDRAGVARSIAGLKSRRNAKEQELARLESGGELAEKTKALRTVEAELLELERQHRARVDDRIRREKRRLDEIQDEANGLQADVRSKQRELESNNAAVQRLESKIQRLRERWHTVNDRAFEFEQDEVCPTCGQTLPKERLDAAREQALADFNRRKAQELEEINADGKAAAAEAEELRNLNGALEQDIEKAQARLAALEEQGAEVRARIDDLEREAEAFADDPAHAQKVAEKHALEVAIAELRTGSAERRAAVERDITAVETEIASLEASLARMDQRTRGKARIEDLKARERDLAAEYERIEEELHLTERFVRTKVSLLEAKINSRFELARFKLFNVLVNGGVEECCETLYRGVPYSTALNNGARINVGLDIINTLSEHYDIAPPIWIDNAEAVTELIPTSGQMIRLVVSGSDEALRIERDGVTNLAKEAV